MRKKETEFHLGQSSRPFQLYYSHDSRVHVILFPLDSINNQMGAPLSGALCNALTSHVDVHALGGSYIPLLHVNDGSGVFGKQLGYLLADV